jgi:hypothetical protein
MATKINRVDSYESDPATVFAMVTDEKFLLAKYEGVGMTNSKVLESTALPDGGHRVRTQRDVATEGVPDFVKKLVGERTTIVETDEWGPAAPDGSRTGTWKADAKTAPMAMHGTFALTPTGSGSQVVISGEVKASVPLIGGKVEKAVAEATEKALREENEFGQGWLASH